MIAQPQIPLLLDQEQVAALSNLLDWALQTSNAFRRQDAFVHQVAQGRLQEALRQAAAVGLIGEPASEDQNVQLSL